MKRTVKLQSHYQRPLRDIGIPRDAMQRQIVDFDVYADGNDYPRTAWFAWVDFTGATVDQFKAAVEDWQKRGIHVSWALGKAPASLQKDSS